MKKLITILPLITLFLLGQTINAQDIQKGAPGMWPAFIKYDAAAPVFKKSAISILDASGKAATLTNGKIRQYEKDTRGYDHYRYQQYLPEQPSQ